jgi:hypothetical protein
MPAWATAESVFGTIDTPVWLAFVRRIPHPAFSHTFRDGIFMRPLAPHVTPGQCISVPFPSFRIIPVYADNNIQIRQLHSKSKNKTRSGRSTSRAISVDQATRRTRLQFYTSSKMSLAISPITSRQSTAKSPAARFSHTRSINFLAWVQLPSTSTSCPASEMRQLARKSR